MDSEDSDQGEEYVQLSKITKIMSKDGNLSRLPSIPTTSRIVWSSSSSSKEDEQKSRRGKEKRGKE